QMNDQLLPASTLKSIISQIKTLQPGDSVSYNRRFIATQPMRIATIPMGYADGLNRALGNGNGCFHIHGKPATILGTICMDMTMVDISNIPCKEGDEVIVFGNTLPVTTVANQANTISYEILSTLSQRIKRVYLHE
ncbi:MAG: alanine racemase C-terminal domain-containing protein, partial [Sediminibacterium sp.]